MCDVQNIGLDWLALLNLVLVPPDLWSTFPSEPWPWPFLLSELCPPSVARALHRCRREPFCQQPFAVQLSFQFAWQTCISTAVVGPALGSRAAAVSKTWASGSWELVRCPWQMCSAPFFLSPTAHWSAFADGYVLPRLLTSRWPFNSTWLTVASGSIGLIGPGSLSSLGAH